MTEFRDEPAEVTVQSSDRPFRGRVWDVHNDTIRFGDETLHRHYIAHPGAAAVIALDENDQILILQQYRHPIRERDWEVPAGLLDVPGEDPMLAAQRELAEEVDLQAARWDHLVSFTQTPGSSSEVIHLYLARELTPTVTDFVRTGEEAEIEPHWVALDEAVSAGLAGRFRNGTLVLGALATAEFLRRERAI